MGNSQKKEVKTKKDQEEQGRDSEDEENDESEPEAEAAAYLDLEICYELTNGTMATFPVKPSWKLELQLFKEDLKKLMKTDKRIELFRDNLTDPLGPAHLTLQTLNITNETVLLVKEYDT